jgi:gliding motility-associated lipoprotein GldH
MNKNKLNFILICFFIFLLVACDPLRVFDQSKSIDDKGWDLKNPVVLETEIKDTVSLHNFYINIRNTSDYAYSNIYLFIKTIFPNGKVARDTIQGILADKEGRWLGKGIGKIRDNQILIRKDIRFPYQGKYIFEIEHGMRKRKLVGIIDVGLRIEKQS